MDATPVIGLFSAQFEIYNITQSIVTRTAPLSDALTLRFFHVLSIFGVPLVVVLYSKISESAKNTQVLRA